MKAYVDEKGNPRTTVLTTKHTKQKCKSVALGHFETEDGYLSCPRD